MRVHRSFPCILPVAFAVGFGFAQSASATPPHQPSVINGGVSTEWKITMYDDSSATHVGITSRRICFSPAGPVGTHDSGKWTTIGLAPNWRGIWRQEGDQIFMYGDRLDNPMVNHDAIQWEMVTNVLSTNNPPPEGYGQMQEWNENQITTTIRAFFNVKFVRAGRC